MNFNKNPLQCISFENLLDPNPFNIHKISAVVADTTDKAIVDAIVEMAKSEGIENLYLMDKTFIKTSLEKQMPKKVELTEDCCICPCCRFDMMGVYDFSNDDTTDPKYCPECGQALDWSDTE